MQNIAESKEYVALYDKRKEERSGSNSIISHDGGIPRSALTWRTHRGFRTVPARSDSRSGIRRHTCLVSAVPCMYEGRGVEGGGRRMDTHAMWLQPSVFSTHRLQSGQRFLRDTSANVPPDST